MVGVSTTPAERNQRPVVVEQRRPRYLVGPHHRLRFGALRVAVAGVDLGDGEDAKVLVGLLERVQRGDRSQAALLVRIPHVHEHDLTANVLERERAVDPIGLTGGHLGRRCRLAGRVQDRPRSRAPDERAGAEHHREQHQQTQHVVILIRCRRNRVQHCAPHSRYARAPSEGSVWRSPVAGRRRWADPSARISSRTN